MNTTYKLTDLHTGRPPESLTSAEWQNYFQFIRLNTQPSSSPFMVKHACKAQQDNPNPKPVHHRNTSYDEYCDFINDMLKVLRSGKKDYCYYIYQISDLLKFEHDSLCTEYLQNDRCFKVWLE